MDRVTALSGHRVGGRGEQDVATECSGCEADGKPLESTDCKRTINHLGRPIDSCSAKKTEASAGRERIRIVFKRKATEEDHAVNVVVHPPSKKQSVVGNSHGLTHISPDSSPVGTCSETEQCRIQGMVGGDLQHDSGDSLGEHSSLLKTPLLESECHPFGVGIATEADEDGRYCAAPRHPMSSVPTTATFSRGLGNASEVVGSCTACLADVSSVTTADHDSCMEPASKEFSVENNWAASESYATTQGSSVDIESSQCGRPDVKPKARTPLGFPSSGVHAVDGEAQVIVCSRLSRSPNSSAIPPPAKRSPLPLPVVRSPLLLSTQNQVSSAESSAEVSLPSISLPDESVGNVDKLSYSKSGLQSLPSSVSTSAALELASTVCGRQKLEAEADVQSMARDLTMWTRHTSVEQATKQDLQSAEDSGNIHGLNNDMAETKQSLDKWDSRHLFQHVASPSEVRLNCIPQLFPCEDPTAQSSDVHCSVGMAPGPRRFSFQRLINGDISDLEDDEDEDDDEYDEGVDEEYGRKDGDMDKDKNGQENGKDGKSEEDQEEEEADEELVEEESEVYSAEWIQSDQPPEQMHDPNVAVSKSESQQSDDMYHGQEGISSKNLCGQRPPSHVHSVCSPSEKGYSGDIETDAEVDAGAHSRCLLSTPDGSSSPSMRQIGHGSPCQGPLVDPDWKTSSNTSTDFCTLPKQLPSSGAIKLKIKMSKEVSLKAAPCTTKSLLASGLLEGCPVHYQGCKGATLLTGVVQDGGILCNCNACKGRIIVNVSGFEKHAGSNARHPSDNIFLDNGKSLRDILKIASKTSEGRFEEALRKAINSTEDESEKNSTRSGCGSVVAHSKKEHSTNAESSGVVLHHHRRSDLTSLKSVQAPQLSQTRDMNLHKMLFLPGGLPDGTEVAYYIKGQHVLAGIKKDHGICCSCCNEVVSCSSFEAHAGWGSRRNPYNSIYLSDGQSLHEVALALVAQKQEEALNDSSKDNDDFCAECGDGGNLVLCDGCPGAYHTECAGLLNIPEGDWFCPLCQDKVGHDKRQPDKRSTRVSGRLSSVSTKEKLQERCQRVVKASKNAIGGCVLCKNGDFLKSGFGAKTIMLCDQCEREYHVGCMKEKGVADLQELPAGEWFCSDDCNRIHNFLEALVLGGPEPVHSSICTAVLEKRQKNSDAGQVKPHDWEFTWQLLHGRRGDPQNGKILSEAAIIFTESFDPIVDATSGRDLISLMVYSRSIRDQDFGGMYCAVLKWNETVVSAAIVRVFGQQFAEMPLVATRSSNRGQGYFQMLMSSIEQLLGVLQVEHLILPAAEGAEGIWINKFGFSKLQDGQLQQFGSEVQMMIFQGSSMLLKAIPPQRSARCYLNN